MLTPPLPTCESRLPLQRRAGGEEACQGSGAPGCSWEGRWKWASPPPPGGPAQVSGFWWGTDSVGRATSPGWPQKRGKKQRPHCRAAAAPVSTQAAPDQPANQKTRRLEAALSLQRGRVGRSGADRGTLGRKKCGREDAGVFQSNANLGRQHAK